MNNRRTLLKAAGALAVLPIVSVSGNAFAAKNAAMRTSMKYQDTPVDGKQCTTCLHFVPGKDAKALGGCKLFPGDTEVSPSGYCTAWSKKA